jgi:hypothetical protein
MRSLLAAAVLAVASTLAAADAPSAAIEPGNAGPDFPFVGEYVGSITALKTGIWRTTPIGLQVACVGDGRFEATEYLGGLPGAGWNGRAKVVLPGRRDGDVVRIDAVPEGIVLDGIVGRVGRPGSSLAYGEVRRIYRTSPTLGMRPPREAIVLFDGRGTDHFTKATMTADGLLAQGAETRDTFSDFTMHVEYRLPFMPVAKDQGRANSGVYLQRRYEVQILDSFGQDPVFNSAGSVYRTKPADVNASFPPLAWQTYDIRFRPAKFDGEHKVSNARLTVWHNGVTIHDDYEIPNKTGAGRNEGPDPLPILLQDHNNPVRFRNVWIVDHTRHPHVDATPKIGPPSPAWHGTPGNLTAVPIPNAAVIHMPQPAVRASY